MSHVDSKDEEVKRILALAKSNDSKESDNSKKDETHKKQEPDMDIEDKGTDDWETNTLEDLDSDW